MVPESKCQSSTKKVADQLRDLELEEGECLASFDMVSLYTNVPVEEAIQLAAERLFSGEFETPPVSKETFIQLLSLCSKDVVMATHDSY